MIDAGLPLVQCLQILGEQQENKAFQRIILQVREDVETGSSLANALKKHPQAFNDLYVNMVAAGEAGGILDTILQRLSTYIEKAARLKAQVKAALIYPATVIAIAILVVYIILWKVIPVFATLFDALGAEPAAADAHRRCGVAVHRPFLVAIIAASSRPPYFAIRRYYKTDSREADHRPDHAASARSRPGAAQDRRRPLLPHAGHPAVGRRPGAGGARHHRQDLRQRGDRAGDPSRSARQVEEGKTIAEPLKTTEQFPPMVVQMISVGETTGAMDTMLSKIAEFYEEEVDLAVAGMMKLIEPVMIFFLGVVIGGIVISMYLPMFDLISKIG